jgi:electron transfer flavoprotein alpha subunit
MSSNILVLCEHNKGSFLKTAYELLSKAKMLSKELGGSVNAVVIGAADTSSLGNYGADKVYTSSGEGFDMLNTGVAAAVVQAAVEACTPKVILAAASPCSKDILPRLAIRLNAGFAPELVDLTFRDGALIGSRPSFTGKVYHDVRINSDLKMYTVRPNAFSVEATGGSATEEALSVSLSEFDTSFKVEDIQTSEVQYIDLTEADRIVSGGRSVKSKESFDTLIRPLAKVLGATAGASRAAVDAGFAEHSEQVGQTGKVVNPSLYIACGISGAIQHLAGMRTSRVIVAVNQDKDAPIFSHATYGIVADMFEICPLLTEALSSGDTPTESKVQKKEVPQVAAAAKPTATEKSSPAVKTTTEPEITKPVGQKVNENVAPLKIEKSVAAPEVQASVPAPVQSQAVASPAGGFVAALDPTALNALEKEIAKLNVELTKVQAELMVKNDISSVKTEVIKAVTEVQKAIKLDVARIEKNARTFQEGGQKSFDKVESAVSTEVRKVREVLRQGIANDTQDIREGLSTIRTTAVAAVVINILVLFLLGIMLMTH